MVRAGVTPDRCAPATVVSDQSTLVNTPGNVHGRGSCTFSDVRHARVLDKDTLDAVRCLYCRQAGPLQLRLLNCFYYCFGQVCYKPAAAFCVPVSNHRGIDSKPLAVVYVVPPEAYITHA